MTASPLLAVTDLRKEYGSVVALADGNLKLAAGEIHALVGENGSGKSTLVGMVAGTVTPTAGTVHVGGIQLLKHTPAASAAAGVMTVFQDGSMLPELTVGQNLYIGTRPDFRPSYRNIDSWGQRLLEESGITGVSTKTTTRYVGPGDRQLIEIARAIHAKPPLLILDEATSALDAGGVGRVMGLIDQAAKAGTAVLFVTHRLGEVFRVADNISVLRDGMWQGTMPAASISIHELVELMAGTSVEMEFPDRPGVPDSAPVVLAARQLTQGSLAEVEVELRAGEILGIAGADGNGQGELLRALGAASGHGGTVTVDGRVIHSPASAKGVVYLSGDRKKESLFPNLSVHENLNVAVLDRLSRAGILRPRQEEQYVNAKVAEFGIRVGSPAQPVASLSGGNQQKVAISRALSSGPRVLLIDEPTRGVDVRSRMDIYRMLRSSAGQGIGVAIVSSDAAELAGICDRIIVMSRGKIIKAISGQDATEDQIVSAFAVPGEALTEHEPTASPEKGAEQKARPVRARLAAIESFLRMGALVLVLLGLFLFASSDNSAFASDQNIYNMLLQTLQFVVVALAEFCVLIVGGIDIAVGATMGLTLVVLSFDAATGSLPIVLAVSVVTAVAVGLAVGGVNALLTEGTKVTPVIATIATMGIAGGMELVLRPTAAGAISPDLMFWLTNSAGPFPVAILVLLPVLVIGDWCLWRSGPGVRLRSVGLHPAYAMRLGIPVVRTRVLAYLACGILAGIAGVFLASTVGIGDPTVGSGYTLPAIAAPVLGGASLLGGRGSLFGCFLGALVLAMANTIVPMLGISDAWSYMIVGILSIIALLAYSRRPQGASGLRSMTRLFRRT
jgi:ribose transport system ATP-binding protein